MKFFHLSDLHIGARLFQRDLSSDHDYIFDQVLEEIKKHQPDALVIAGDIFDKAIPSAEAVATFNRFVSRLKKEVPDLHVMMISGNHDNNERIDLFRDVLCYEKIHMIGKAPNKPDQRIEKVVLQDEFGEVNFYLLPFVRPSMVRPLALSEYAIAANDKTENETKSKIRKQNAESDQPELIPEKYCVSSYQQALQYLLNREEIDLSKRNVIVSHQFYLPASSKADQLDRCDSEIKTIGNIDRIDAELLDGFDYVALGHIHKPMKCKGENIRYCGSPIPLSVSESRQKKQILMIDLHEKGNQSVTSIELKPKRQVVKLSDLAENLLSKYSEYENDYVSVEITDPVDLNMSDVNDRLRMKYPYLLDIVRKTDYRRENHEETSEKTKQLSPMELCLDFAGIRSIAFDAEELNLLQQAINEAWMEE